MGINEIVLLLVVIALGVATFALASYAWDERVMLRAFGRAIVQRYFTISIDTGRLADLRGETLDTNDDALCHDTPQTTPDDTDRQTADRSTALSRTEQLLRLDRTRTGVVKALLLNGWTPTQIRPLLRGDNNTISQEIEQAKSDLGGADDPQFEQVGSRQQFVRTNAKPMR